MYISNLEPAQTQTKIAQKNEHKKVEFEQSEFRVARIIEIYFTFPPLFFALKTTFFFSPAMSRQGHWTSWWYGQSGTVAHYWGSGWCVNLKVGYPAYNGSDIIKDGLSSPYYINQG